MANVLRITDGTITVNLAGGDSIELLDYDPLVSLDVSPDAPPITEPVQIKFTSTASANTTNLQKINRLFEQARNYARTETGPRVYAHFDPGTSGTVWRSMLFNGKVNLNSQILGPLYDKVFLATIEWTRQPFWDGALTAVPLTNTSATDDVAGIVVNNCEDNGTRQVETATVVGPIDPAGAGNADFILTASGMTGTPITTSVPVANDDTGAEVAALAVTAMLADGDITALFSVKAVGADLIVSKLLVAANDATLNIAYDNDTCTGLTPDATSESTTAGSTAVRENFVDIKAADVIGDLPAPIKVEMYNSKATADASDEFRINHNVYSNPASLDYIYEGEDATGATVTDTADGTSSDGEYAALSYTATVETLIASWALSTAEITFMAGGRFGIIARWADAFPYADMWLRFKINDVGWVGDLSIIPDLRALHQLQVLRLPPYLQGLANLKGVTLSLYATRNQSGAHTIPLDYLQLSPISGDNGWKHFVSTNKGVSGVAYQEYFTHDATEGWTYRTDTSADIISDFSDPSGEILLVPNAVQRLQFLSVDINGLAKTDQTWTVKMWYRPRRNAL